MSKQRCQQETSSTEFNRWLQYLDIRQRRRGKEDFYLAQIALEVRRGNQRKKKHKLEDFYVRWKDKPKKRWSPERLQQSKNFWLQGVGLDDGNENGTGNAARQTGRGR